MRRNRRRWSLRPTAPLYRTTKHQSPVFFPLYLLLLLFILLLLHFLLLLFLVLRLLLCLNAPVVVALCSRASGAWLRARRRGSSGAAKAPWQRWHRRPCLRSTMWGYSGARRMAQRSVRWYRGLARSSPAHAVKEKAWRVSSGAIFSRGKGLAQYELRGHTQREEKA